MDRVWMVFPGRRAALYFNRFLAGLVTRPVWMPRVMTISELFHGFSGLRPADPLYVNMRLYRAYCRLHPEPEKFDDFYSWGEMVVNDFNEVDKYLVDPADLFRNIRSLREIDEHFNYLDESQREAVRWFWDAIPPEDQGDKRENFLRLWSILPGLYKALVSDLREAGLAYDGMIYREVAEQIRQGTDLPCDADRVCFVGFSALNTCEKTLFAHFRDRNLASFFWDYDSWYTGDSLQEAGFFIRENLLAFPQSDTGMDFSVLNRPGREVQVIETSSRMEEARTVTSLLASIPGAGEKDPSHTAVVMADESLLMPVMYSIPAGVDEINVTMGYPLKDAPVFPVLNALFRLLRNRRGSPDKPLLFSRDVLELLSQQMVRDLDPAGCRELTDSIRRTNRLFVPVTGLSEHPVLGFLFRLPPGDPGIPAFLLEVLSRFFSHASQEERTDEHRMTREFIYHVHESVRKLQELVGLEKLDLSLATYLSLLRRYLHRIRIPFEGEPLAGLQVMGLMETRSLDFRHVILLSAGEGLLPATRTSGSFIPYNLRKGFGLPVIEHQDSIFAYYFYRLIQRAEKVWLVYTGVDKGMVTGEASRFIHQMRYDSRIRIVDQRNRIPAGKTEQQPVRVAKDAAIMQLLNRYLDPAGNRPSLSPTALNTYLDCSLRFYYRYLARIRELEEPEGQLDQAALGSLVHHAMKILYGQKAGQTVEAEWLKQLEKETGTLEKALDQAFRDIWFKSSELPAFEGNLLLAREVILEYLRTIIRYDHTQAPFRLLSLESPVYMDLRFTCREEERQVRIGGTIDRVDLKDEVIRILDYKTGGNDLKYKGISSLFERARPARNHEVFQTLLYSLVYREAIQPAAGIRPGLYFVRKMNQPASSCLLYDSERKKELYELSEVGGSFRQELADLLAELFDPAIPFEQVTERRICEYCPYRSVCNR